MKKLLPKNGYVLCVEHADKPQSKAVKPRLLLAVDKPTTYDVVACSDRCCVELHPGNEVIAASEGSKFRIDPTAAIEYGLPEGTEWAWLFKDANIAAKLA